VQFVLENRAKVDGTKYSSRAKDAFMSTVEKLSIALAPEMAEAVRSAVNAGVYASTSEVIREALRDWRQKRELQAQQIAENSWIAPRKSEHGCVAKDCAS
jgi:antitoxin ParD1/3/4